MLALISWERAMGRRDPEREARWRKLIAQWEQSGQGIKAFCVAHGVTEGAFYAWRRELRQRDGKAPALPRRAKRAKGAKRRFVQIAVAPATPPIRIHISTDLVIDVPATLDSDCLTRIFTAARSAGSC